MFNIREMIALLGVPDIGPNRFRKLVAHFGSPENVFKASIGEIQKVDGQLKILDKTGSKIITYWDEDYPENLKNIDDPPIYLFVKGKIVPDDKFAISIVGSRKPTQYGKISAGKLSEELAEKGFTIVSGMAYGIDSIAHQGALKVKGRTIAVLGCGIDIIYPKENKSLYKKITENGAVISEFPFRTRPDAGNFPSRNRIISGLGLGVLIVEAGEKSGALITANLALEQNREVFAVPGTMGSSLSAGTNKLIKDSSAKLIESADDIIVEIENQLKDFKKSKEKQEKKVSLSEEEKKIYDILSENPLYIDKIAEKLHIQTQVALTTLLELELKGLIKQVPGKQFIKI